MVYSADAGVVHKLGSLRNRTAERLRTADEKLWRETVHSQSFATFFRHSALLLRKLPNIDIDNQRFSCSEPLLNDDIHIKLCHMI